MHDMPIAWCSTCQPAEPLQLDSVSASSTAPDEAAPVWREYDRWNQAIARAVYTPEHALQPVYLDMEDELLTTVGAELEMEDEPQAIVDALCRNVRGTLLLGTGPAGGVFSQHRKRINAWRSRMAREGAAADDPPPVIALLAVFARAAEVMEKDKNFSATAYYPRLARLLDVAPADTARLQASFRKESASFWDGLNEWLTGVGNALGLPTAEPIGHPYVGIPLSQALIRSGDRQRFSQFFDAVNLEPGEVLGAEDLTHLLARWIASGGASPSISRIWQSTSGRAIVTEAAAQALARWTGTIRADSSGSRYVAAPVLTARVTKRVGAKRLRLGFAIRGRSEGPDRIPNEWMIHSAQKHLEVRLEAINDRLLSSDFPEGVDVSNLLTGELRLHARTGDETLKARPRRPQPLLVLSYVDEAGLFVEVDRVRTLEQHHLLVNLASKILSRPGAEPFDSLLEHIAEPGWTKDESIHGLPSGWALYRSVRVARPHLLKNPLLEALKPEQTSTLTVSGGLRLPGHAERWHAGVGLQLQGSAVESTDLTLSLLKMGDDHANHTWSGSVDEIAVSTAELGLEAGAYRIELVSHRDGKTHSAARSFELCDSDEPRIRPRAEPIDYHLELPLGTLTASPDADEAPESLHGRTTSGTNNCQPEKPWWRLAYVEHAAEALAAPAAPGSCVFTGAHNWRLEAQKKRAKRIRGECKWCGRVAWFPPTGKLKQETEDGRSYSAAPLRRMAIGNQSSDISSESILDALTWLRGGTSSELARVVRQVDDSALTVDEVVRALETLGHIDVVRDPRSFAVKGWELRPRGLAQLADGTWLATGSWTRSDVASLADVAEEYGGLLKADVDSWIPRRIVVGVDQASAQEIGEVLDALVQPDAGHRLLAKLPPLSASMDHLHLVSAEGMHDAEWFDPTLAQWVDVQSIGVPGAYRTQRFNASYFVRTAEDVDAGRLRRADSRVVKHLACRSRPIVGYDPDSSRLLVPLGADLPGLYGRAVSLLSGRPPARVEGQALIAYSSVDYHAARSLVSLLKG